jgi:prepilin-type N-terminal cleavage/methylation domain-containing protein
MNTILSQPGRTGRRGFTLMETVIAIGVVAVLLTTFLAVFGPATSSIRRVLSAQEAGRLTTTLERELSTLRVGPDDDYDNSFHKAFEWIRDSGKSDKVVLLYNYRGDPKQIREDATLEPFTLDGGESGRDFILQPAVRRMGDAENDLKDDLEEVEGRVYLVRMTQMIFDDGQDPVLIPGSHGEIKNMHSHDAIDNVVSYPGAIIAYTGDFYALKSNSYEFIERLDLSDTNGDGNPDSLGRPLFSRNLGVRR